MAALRSVAGRPGKSTTPSYEGAAPARGCLPGREAIDDPTTIDNMGALLGDIWGRIVGSRNAGPGPEGGGE